MISLIILVAFAISIIITLITLPNFGDERNKLIKSKAQSVGFIAAIASLILESLKLYYAIFHDNEYIVDLVNTLVSTSIIYLAALLYYRRKYGY